MHIHRTATIENKSINKENLKGDLDCFNSYQLIDPINLLQIKQKDFEIKIQKRRAIIERKKKV